MTPQHSLEEVASLLMKFPGVSSAKAWRREAATDVYVCFRCYDLETLGILGRESTWANVQIVVGDDSGGAAVESNDNTGLPFIVVIPDAERGTPTQCERFGVYLAERLCEMEVISRTDRDRLHALWNTRLSRRRSS